MIYLLIGGAVFAGLVWLGRKGRLPASGVRFLIGGAAVAVFSGSAFLAIRGAYLAAAALFAIGGALAVSARAPLKAPARDIGDAEARSILGVSATADEAEIRAAYQRLIVRVHPDRGGAEGLAAQLNAARDRLLKRK